MTLDHKKILEIAKIEARRLYGSFPLDHENEEQVLRVLVAHIQGELDALRIRVETRLEDLERRVSELSK